LSIKAYYAIHFVLVPERNFRLIVDPLPGEKLDLPHDPENEVLPDNSKFKILWFIKMFA
jgi:hypothetical protein